MKISLLFMAYSNLGTSEAMFREVPYAVGKGCQARAERVKRAAWGLNFITSSLLALVVFGYFSLVRTDMGGDIRLAWHLFVLFFLMSQAFWYTVFRLQSERRIVHSGLIIIGLSAASTVLGTASAYLWGLPGLLAAMVASTALVLILGGGWSTYFAPLFNLHLFYELVSKGFPIMMSVALLTMLWNVDKIAISLFMDTRSLGVYALQSYIINILTIIPHAVSTVLYPSLMEKIGMAKEENTVKNHLIQPTLAMSYLICPFLSAIFIALPIPIRWFLPQYIAAVLPGQIMVFAFFFSIIARMPVIILISLNRQKLVMLLTLIAVICGFFFDWFFVMRGLGLAGVAVGTALSLIVYACLALGFSLREINMPGKEVGLFLVKSLAPFFASFALSLFVCSYLTGQAESLIADVGGGLIRILTVFAGMALFYGFLNKRLDLLYSIARQR